MSRPSYTWLAAVLAAVAAALWSPFRMAATRADDTPPPAAESTSEGLERAETEQYYELLRLFADTLDQVERNYVEDISRRELLEAAIDGMLTKLDQYSDYIPPEEIDRFRSGVESEFGGIGVRVGYENGALVVSSPLPGTPAYRAGMVAGDRIIRIGEQATGELTLDAAIKLIKGRPGTKVTLTVLREGAPEPLELTLERAVIQVETVMGDTRGGDDGGWRFMIDEEQKIAYVRVTAFARNTGPELRRVIASLREQGLRGLVLDLRSNPGGLLSAAIEVSDLFISSGRIVSTAGRNVEEQVWDATAEGTFEGFPMAVLVNHFSASASEIVAACLKDHGRAVIVGERTWGKGSVQNIVELERGRSALKLTTAGYRRPNGANIHRTEGATEEDTWGVKPNEGFEVVVEGGEMIEYWRRRRERDVLRPNGEPPTEAPFFDRPLARALEFIRGELAKPGDDSESNENS